jgi:hypothetical protein
MIKLCESVILMQFFVAKKELKKEWEGVILWIKNP